MMNIAREMNWGSEPRLTQNTTLKHCYTKTVNQAPVTNDLDLQFLQLFPPHFRKNIWSSRQPSSKIFFWYRL